MKRILVAVDLQNDFIDGSLGTPEARAIVPAAVRVIEGFDGLVFATLDTHDERYPLTREGRLLPVPHCVKGTRGHEPAPPVMERLSAKGAVFVEKTSFGSAELPELIARAAGGDPDEIELIGLCTDVCVVSNALLLKARFPEAEISVDASACAGVTPALHEAALKTMASCQITIKNNE